MARSIQHIPSALYDLYCKLIKNYGVDKAFDKNPLVFAEVRDVYYHELLVLYLIFRIIEAVTEDIPIPFNLLQAFQGKSHLAIATRFSADVDNVPRNQWDYWGGAFERDYNGNTAYVDITVKDS